MSFRPPSRNLHSSGLEVLRNRYSPELLAGFFVFAFECCFWGARVKRFAGDLRLSVRMRDIACIVGPLFKNNPRGFGKFPRVDFPVRAEFNCFPERKECRKNRVHVETSRGFALLGPWIRVIHGVVRNGPLARFDVFQGEPPKVQKLSANPECVCGDFFTRRLRWVAGLVQAGEGLVYPDDGNARKAVSDVDCTFACSATGI